MNELRESDEEENQADCEDKLDMLEEDDDDEETGGDLDEHSLSLIASDDEYDRVKKRKEKDAKINNSYTGPYPLDPTDFNHTDKGPNFQFVHFFKQNNHK